MGRHSMHAAGDGERKVQGMMTYYDNRLGRTRYKRRYIWAMCGFVAGVVLGALIGWVI